MNFTLLDVWWLFHLCLLWENSAIFINPWTSWFSPLLTSVHLLLLFLFLSSCLLEFSLRVYSFWQLFSLSVCDLCGAVFLFIHFFTSLSLVLQSCVCSVCLYATTVHLIWQPYNNLLKRSWPLFPTRLSNLIVCATPCVV